jgi:hypothetical protein
MTSLRISTNAANVKLPECKGETIDEDGNLILCTSLGHNEGCFKVLTTAVRLASSGFKKELESYRPEIIKSNGKDVALLRLLESDPTTMHILLLVAHLQFNKVPTEVPLETMASIAKICLKYEARELVSRFIEQWLAPIRAVELDGSTVANRLWLGEVFKDHDECHKCVQYVMNNTRLKGVAR